jgi:hypothetical protein
MIRSHASLIRLLLLLIVVAAAATALGGFSWNGPDSASITGW